MTTKMKKTKSTCNSRCIIDSDENRQSSHHIVGEGLVPSHGENAKLILGNPGGHKTLPYTMGGYIGAFPNPTGQ